MFFVYGFYVSYLIVYFRQSSLYTLDLLYDLHLAPRNHQECGLIERYLN